MSQWVGAQDVMNYCCLFQHFQHCLAQGSVRDQSPSV
jgi:hypothetical protein